MLNFKWIVMKSLKNWLLLNKFLKDIGRGLLKKLWLISLNIKSQLKKIKIKVIHWKKNK
jgi:hypothetical protein